MPLLNWTPGALAAVPSKGQRQEMTRLFDAYCRAARDGGHELPETSLPLDLPSDNKNRHYLYAKFTKTGWFVQATLKHEYRKVQWVRAVPEVQWGHALPKPL